MEKWCDEIRSRVLQQIDYSREVPDEELREIIAREMAGVTELNQISISQRINLEQRVFNSLRKLDILQELLEDETITEIMVNGPDCVFYEKDGLVERYPYHFASEEKLQDVIQQIVGRHNRVVNMSKPIVDSRLDDGSRVNVVLSPIAVDGSAISIRKFSKVPLEMESLVQKETLSQEMAIFLKKLVIARYNLFISGGTSSGKTTFLNALAKEVIEEDFHEQKTKLTIKDYYVSDKVEAEWIFSPEEYVNKDGSILFQNLPDEGGVLQVTVLLTCGAYEEIYSFPVWLDLGLLSQQDKLRIKLEKELELLLEQKEVKTIPLPTHIDGKAVKWSEKRGFLFFKLLFLELIAIALLVLSARQKEKQEDEKRKAEIEITYADVVNQLVILLRAGMTTRQAWSQIAKQQKARNQLESTVVYEAIQRLSMRMKEGEKERLAYELFAKEVDVTCYRRLMRVLAANLEKGSSDLSCYLEEESRNAYEERILIAKKKGEEISTKMLLPLIMMMVLVMAIVLIPAMISFSG